MSTLHYILQEPFAFSLILHIISSVGISVIVIWFTYPRSLKSPQRNNSRGVNWKKPSRQLTS